MTKKTFEELKKEIMKSSEMREGDYFYPHDTSETKAKWRDKGYESNLTHSFFKVLKVNPKSLRVMDLETCQVATLSKEKWRSYEYPEPEREIMLTKIFDKYEIDEQLRKHGIKKCM